eukprot:Sspe_Gene.365::Locus_129_Transcript_5_5_Confidence_0.533_Length_617::g.365::m.365
MTARSRSARRRWMQAVDEPGLHTFCRDGKCEQAIQGCPAPPMCADGSFDGSFPTPKYAPLVLGCVRRLMKASTQCVLPIERECHYPSFPCRPGVCCATPN